CRRSRTWGGRSARESARRPGSQPFAIPPPLPGCLSAPPLAMHCGDAVVQIEHVRDGVALSGPDVRG
ncbi:MAG: hypothetical protein AVDCRST_MAG19-2754, partial [uncultured Thermomicrobiales bacterium]